MSGEEIFNWIKACPNKFWKELRLENGVCKLHVPDHTDWYSKSLDFLLNGETGEEDGDGSFLIYSHRWESIDECDYSEVSPIVLINSFNDVKVSSYVHSRKEKA